jgi:hypothetical protein
MMTVQTLPLETLRYAPPRVTEFEIELLPHRLCISYTADDCESISLGVGESLFLHRVLSESGHTELIGGVWA